ncbi:5-hydroxytryptamine receptor 2C-like [Pocillopora verrucosa]|uniref:5-hydroxytryptamine receptor 2C-like n=1 Tax=Pocillopora verrucosa TaxID=203993 RepID=UPI0033401A0F
MEPDIVETAKNNFSTDRSVFFCSQYEFFTWDLENTTFPWIIVGSIILLSPVTILMNLLVIVTVAKRRDLQKLSNILLRSLALVDLLVGAVSMPLSATVDVLILRQMPVEYICDLDLANITVFYFLSILSLYHLTVIAWERNVAIRKGLQYRVLVSKSLLVKLSIFAWLVAVFSDLPATILTITEEDVEIIDMWMTIECTLMVICVIIIAYYNILVYLGVRKRKKNQIVPLTANQKMESKTAKICGLLTFVIFSSFLPKLLISIFSEIFPAPLQSNSVFRLTETLVQLNSLLTPLIYWYRDRRFRNAVLEILRLRKPQPIHPPVAARIACRGNPVGTVAEQHD